MFDPDDFKNEANVFTVDAYRLPEQGLLEYAKLATRLREQFSLKAQAAIEADE